MVVGVPCKTAATYDTYSHLAVPYDTYSHLVVSTYVVPGTSVVVSVFLSACPWGKKRIHFFVFVFLFSFFFFFQIHPIYYIGPCCSLSLVVVTQMRGHTAGSSPPPPHYGACLALFCRGKTSARSSLVDSRRIVPSHGRRSQQFILIYFYEYIKTAIAAGILQHQHY